MDYFKLKTELDKPENAGKTSAQIAQELNALSVDYSVTVPTSDVHNFLVNHGLYGKLLDAYRNHQMLQIRIVAETALDAVMGQIPELDLAVNGAIGQGLLGLVQGGVFTQADADSVLALAKRSRSRAEVEFGAEVTEVDIQIARNQGALGEVQSLLERAATAYGDVLGQLQGVQTRLRAGEIVAVPDSGAIAARFSEVLG